MLDAVGIGGSIGCSADGDAAWDSGCLGQGHWGEDRVEDCAIVEIMLVVVRKRIAIFGDDGTRWIYLHHDSATVFLPEGEEAWGVRVDAIVC